MHTCVLSYFSRIWFFAILWKIAHKCLAFWGSSVNGILQARKLEWIAIPSSRGSSWPKDWTCISCLSGGFFTHWAQIIYTYVNIWHLFFSFWATSLCIAGSRKVYLSTTESNLLCPIIVFRFSLSMLFSLFCDVPFNFLELILLDTYHTWCFINFKKIVTSFFANMVLSPFSPLSSFRTPILNPYIYIFIYKSGMYVIACVKVKPYYLYK